MRKIKTNRMNAAEERVVGNIPDQWGTKFMNWCNYVYSPKEAHQQFLQWAERNGYDADPSQRISSSLLWMTVAISNNVDLPRNVEISRLKMLAKIKPQQQITEKATSPRQRTIQTAMAVTADVDEILDNKQYTCDWYTFLQEKEVKAPQARVISEHYQPLLDELRLAYNNKDPEITEAYKTHKRTEIKRLLDCMKNLIDDCNAIASNAKRRRKKTKNPIKQARSIKQAAGVKYQADCPVFKVESVDPALIVGARELWLLNTRANQIARVVAASEDGLSLSRSTVRNYDESQSGQKRIGRRKDVVKRVADQTPRQLIKLFDQLTGNVQPTKGRITENTVILRVVN